MKYNSTNLLKIGLIIALSLAMNCRDSAKPANLAEWRGVALSGEKINFSSVKAEALLLNIFSHTCTPCLEELAALEVIYDLALQRGVAMYIVADGNPETHGYMVVTEKDRIETEKLLHKSLKAVQTRYKLRIPIIIMDPAIDLASKQGYVKSLPMTFLLKPTTLQLLELHNGAISTQKERNKIIKEIETATLYQRLNELPAVTPDSQANRQPTSR